MTSPSDESVLVLYQTDDGITRLHVQLVEGTLGRVRRVVLRFEHDAGARRKTGGGMEMDVRQGRAGQHQKHQADQAP